MLVSKPAIMIWRKVVVLYTDPDERVHEYAVRCLDKEGDEKLELYMNQLVQVEK